MFPSGAKRAMQTLRPGDTTPESGVYRINHEQHRPEHLVTMLKGESLPSCCACGDAVRFALVRAAGAEHEVVLLTGDIFPRCETCQSEVAFRLIRTAPYIFQDADFEEN